MSTTTNRLGLRPPRATSRRLLLAGGGTMACSLLAATGLSTAAFAGGGAPAAVGWTRISGGTTSATAAGAQLGLARTADGTLHVISNHGTNSTTISETRISPAGHVLGTTTVASGWDGNGGLALLVMPNHSLRLFAAGEHEGGPGGPLDGINSFTAPAGGVTWTRVAGEAWGGVFGAGAGQIAATLAPGGQPVTAWSNNYHVGLGAPSATPIVHPDIFNPQLATDAKTCAVVYSAVTIAGKGGTYAQQLLPSLGPARLLGSNTQSAGSGETARIGAGGVYIVTANGNAQVLALTRYGGGTIDVARGAGYELTNVVAAPGGRLWILWWNFRGTDMLVTRSNGAVTKFEPVQTLPLPANADGVSGIQGNGSLGPLDLFADMLVGNDTGFLYTHVLAEMTVTTAVSAITSKKHKVIGSELKVTVTDAGDPLAGASVTVGAKVAMTKTFGVATFDYAGTPPGRVPLTVTAPGYKPVTASTGL